MESIEREWLKHGVPPFRRSEARANSTTWKVLNAMQGRDTIRRLERFKKYRSHSVGTIRERSFWVLASFRLSHRSLRTCSFAKSSLRTATVFLKTL